MGDSEQQSWIVSKAENKGLDWKGKDGNAISIKGTM